LNSENNLDQLYIPVTKYFAKTLKNKRFGVVNSNNLLELCRIIYILLFSLNKNGTF